MPTLRCPHCGRSWDAADLDMAGRPTTLILDEHVRLFCPGSSAPPGGPRTKTGPRLAAAR